LTGSSASGADKWHTSRNLVRLSAAMDEACIHSTAQHSTAQHSTASHS
jgi:hypothetical protein